MGGTWMAGALLVQMLTKLGWKFSVEVTTWKTWS